MAPETKGAIKLLLSLLSSDKPCGESNIPGQRKAWLAGEAALHTVLKPPPAQAETPFRQGLFKVPGERGSSLNQAIGLPRVVPIAL